MKFVDEAAIHIEPVMAAMAASASVVKNIFRVAAQTAAMAVTAAMFICWPMKP